MRFGVLGPLSVWTEAGASVRIPELKVRALLADLLVQDGRPLSVDRLADDLWGGALPGNPLNTLQTKISLLRRALEAAEPGAGSAVVRQPPGYLLRTAPDAIDAWRFRSLVTRAHQAEGAHDRAALLAEALGLWRGPALADFADEEFARIAIAGLEEQRLTALEDLSEVRLELGQHVRLAAELAGLVVEHPLRERLRAAHMLALCRAGRQGEALASYRDLEEHLARELGLRPGPELATLRQRMTSQDPTLIPPTSAVPDISRPRTNLPAPITDLIGRADAVAEVCRLLKSGRLVTLTGPGGVGKTRLAIETAAGLVDGLPDGPWLVELSGLSGQAGEEAIAALAQAVMSVLGLRDDVPPGPREGRRPSERLAGALRTSRALLVLDNCEHMIEPVATLTGMLLERAPGLRILATSREPIGLAGEVVYPVQPLTQTSATELFLTRARAAAPGFALGPDDADAVSGLCRRLDGMPLALELAASRVRALGLHELVARLDDRFRLLTDGHRGAPPRQQTLRATIDWSWDLLSDPERLVLRRLAVHAESFTVEAAESVSAGQGVRSEDVLALLVRLVDRSLVARTGDPRHPRFRLLESIAAYCAERLEEAGETDAVRRRHGVYYAELADRAERELYGDAQQQWLERLDAESPNIRRALEGAPRDRRPDVALRLVNAMTWYWFLRGQLLEALRSLDAALAVSHDLEAGARARALAWHRGIAALVGEVDRDAPRQSAVQLVQDIADRRAQARARWFLGFVECDVGELSVSEQMVTNALDECRELEDRWGVASALSTRAKQAMIRGDLAEVERSGSASLALFREIGDRWGQLQSTEWLGARASSLGDFGKAEQLHLEGLTIADELGLWPQAADRLSWLGRVAMHLGDYGRARELHERAMALSVRQSYRPGEIFAELGLGLVARREGRLDKAELHLRRALERSRDLNGEPGVAIALGLTELGFVAEQRGDVGASQALHLDGLAAARQLGDPRMVALALEGLAGARAVAGYHVEAARLLGVAHASRLSAGVPPPAAELGDVDRISGTTQAALGNDVFAREFALGADSSPEDLLHLGGLDDVVARP